VAFDYSLDPEGRPVLWEAHPYPYLHFSRASLTYRNEAMHRTIAILVAFYFQRAMLCMPGKLASYLNGSRAISPPATAADSESQAAGWQIPPAKSRPAIRRATDSLRDALRSLRKQLSGANPNMG